MSSLDSAYIFDWPLCRLTKALNWSSVMTRLRASLMEVSEPEFSTLENLYRVDRHRDRVDQ